MISDPGEPARNGENPTRDTSEETQVLNSQTANQEPEPQQGKGFREPERRVTRVRGKGPNKFTPWGMAAGQGSLKKVIKKLGGARGSGRH